MSSRPKTSPQQSTTVPVVRRAAPARGMAVIASLLVVVGSFLPWVHTALGNVSGINGPGLWTAYAAFVGLAGAVMPWRRIGAAHLSVFAAVALVLPTWQVVHVLGLVGVGGWLPGTGLVLVACGGVLAATAAMRSWRGY